MRLKTLLIMASVACGVSGASRAQDLVAIAPQNTTVEYEDAGVRVVRLRIPPHGSLPRHDRPARVVVSLTANNAQLTRPDGTTSITRTEAGSVAWSEPAVRSVANLSDAPLENIVIELRTAHEPARRLGGPPSPPPGNYLSDRFHHWVFENQYVRVFDVRIPPGATTEFHRHATRSVVVFVSGGRVSTERQGEAWGSAENIKAGGVTFSDDSGQPFTHRVRNEGASEYRVLLVHFLQHVNRGPQHRAVRRQAEGLAAPLHHGAPSR